MKKKIKNNKRLEQILTKICNDFKINNSKKTIEEFLKNKDNII